MIPPKHLTVISDQNELEFVRTIKGKELIYEYRFIKSNTKEGLIMTISEENLIKNLKREIFKNND